MFRGATGSQKTDQAALFLESSDEKDGKTPKSHPVALYKEKEEEPLEKQSFWDRFFVASTDDPFSENAETEESEKPEQVEPVSLAAAEKAEKLGDSDKAAKLYRAFLTEKGIKKTNAEYATAYGKYGMLLARRGDFGAAELMYLRSLELNPHDHEIAGAYSQTLFEQKRYSEAAAVARDVVNRHGEDPRVCYYLGESLLALQRYQEGFRYLKKAIGEPDARLRMAQAYYSDGDVDAAQFAMQKHDQYYASRGLTPPMRSDMQFAASSSQSVQQTTDFPQKALPIAASRSSLPPESIRRASISGFANSQPVLPMAPLSMVNQNPGTVFTQNIHASSSQINQNENPLSVVQSQQKPSQDTAQGGTQNASVRVATPLTLSHKISVTSDSKIE